MQEDGTQAGRRRRRAAGRSANSPRRSLRSVSQPVAVPLLREWVNTPAYSVKRRREISVVQRPHLSPMSPAGRACRARPAALLRVLAGAAAVCGVAFVPMMWVMANAEQASSKIVVAHRGASGYAPEHTAAAYRLALAQGADYVEQDLAVTRDGALVSIHDPTLERTTNVEDVFPDRFTIDAKGEKRWYVADFTLAELKRLDAGTWFDPKFAGERILTWDEIVAVVAGRAGLYPELKSPEVYRARGVDMTAVFASAWRATGLDTTRTVRGRAPLVLQSFDEQALRDAARLLPTVPRTFLVGSEAVAAAWLGSADAVRHVAAFATGIGPAKTLLQGRPAIVQWAHAAGLTVTPYTFRASDPGTFPDVTAEMTYFLYDLGVDALFTDNPDRFPRP